MVSIRQLSWICWNQKWVRRLRGEQFDQLREFLVAVQKAAIAERLSPYGLEAILEPYQFIAGTRIPKEFVEDTTFSLVKRYLSTACQSCFETLFKGLGGRISAKELILILLALSIRCGYKPSAEEFNSLWVFILRQFSWQSKYIPQTLTKEDKNRILIVWGGILPNTFTTLLRSISPEKTSLEIYNVLKSTILVKP